MSFAWDDCLFKIKSALEIIQSTFSYIPARKSETIALIGKIAVLLKAGQLGAHGAALHRKIIRKLLAVHINGKAFAFRLGRLCRQKGHKLLAGGSFGHVNYFFVHFKIFFGKEPDEISRDGGVAGTNFGAGGQKAFGFYP